MKIRTVFDSNVYVAAALKPGGYADTWLDIAALPNTGLQLCSSAAILSEVRRKLVSKLGLPASEVKPFIAHIRQVAIMVTPSETVVAVKNDPDDNAIIECALAAHAQLIISADNHLLKLNPYRGIGIAHPRELKNIFAGDADL